MAAAFGAPTDNSSNDSIAACSGAGVLSAATICMVAFLELGRLKKHPLNRDGDQTS